MAWYDTGTVSVTNGSTTVTGSGTDFVSGAQVGEAFYGPDDNLYEIQAIVSATQLTLADAYLGSTQTGQAYKIVPTQSLVADLATQVSTLISDFQTVADEAGEGKFDDGSATSPGITFTQDQDTGFFRDTANEIGIAVAGAKVGEFNSTGVAFDDNNKATFGTGSDLQIYHDGANSFIADVGTGNLKVRGENLRLEDTSGNRYLQGVAGGATTLYYAGSALINTTSTGLDVTGTVTADGLTVDGATDGTAVALLRADNTGVTKKNTLRFEDTDTTTQNDQQLGRIEFYSNDTDHTGVDAVIEAVSATTGLKELRFLTSDTANTPLSRLAINKGGDISFYEDTGNTPKFYWDASAESLGIGTTSPDAQLDIESATQAVLRLNHTGTNYWELQNDSNLKFNRGGTERMRIDASGNLLVGTTNSDPALNNVSGVAAEPEGRIQASRLGAVAATFNRQSSDGAVVQFRKDATTVGTVSVTASATSYNTSSDYRLKEDVQPMTGASERVLALNPVNFAWKSDGSRVDGFLAHEAQAVVPEAVHGEKDEVDEDGNPVYQGIDQSKLVPLLTAALQEALNKIDDLEARVAALEAK